MHLGCMLDLAPCKFVTVEYNECNHADMLREATKVEGRMQGTLPAEGQWPCGWSAGAVGESVHCFMARFSERTLALGKKCKCPRSLSNVWM